MTLKTQQAEDVSVFLNTDDFSETATYYSVAGGEARSVVCNIDEDGELLDSGRDQYDRVALTVTVARDADDGIDDPRKGDYLIREGGADKFAYDGPDGGPSLDGNTNIWTLRFVRELPFEIGGPRR
jgi:hypothetical protein